VNNQGGRPYREHPQTERAGRIGERMRFLGKEEEEGSWEALK
jgi:hypothetical protein